MSRWLHRLAHWFGCYHGHPVVWCEHDGKMYAGFQCAKCGKLTERHECKKGGR